MLIKLAWRNLWRQKRRTLLTATALALVLFLSLLTRAFQEGSYSSNIKNAAKFYTGLIQLQNPEFGDSSSIDDVLPQTDAFISASKANSDIDVILPRVESFALAAKGERSKGVMVLGVDPESENAYSHISDKLVQGEFIASGKNAVLVGGGLAQYLRLKVGDELVLYGAGYRGQTAAGLYRVAGILHFPLQQLDSQLVYMPLDTAQTLYSLDKQVTAWVLNTSNLRVLPSVIEQLKRDYGNSVAVKGWQELSPELSQQIALDKAGGFLADGMIASARSSRGIRINGIHLEQEQKITPLSEHIIDGYWLDEEGRNPILVSQKTAKRLKLRVGSKVILTLSDINGDVSGAAFRVKGIFKTPSTTFDDGNVYVRKADLEKIAGVAGAHEIAILLNANDDDVLQNIESFTRTLIDDGSGKPLTVRTWLEIQPLLSTMMSSMDISNQVMLVVFVLAMTLGIVNIMLMSVFERTREFGVLMAVGMQQHKIRILITLETMFLGLTGCALGLFGSAAMIKLLSVTGLSLGGLADGLGAYGVDTLLYPRVSFYEYQMIIVAIFMASLFAALYPARQILKHRPADAMGEKT